MKSRPSTKQIVRLLLMGGGALGLCVIVAHGCTTRPHAPALGDEPVYQNKQEGFRFLAPEGWVQYAKREYPPGRADKERLLVAYRRPKSEQVAALEVSLVDLPRSTDLAKYFAGVSNGVQLWLPAGPPEQADVDGVTGSRFAYTGVLGHEALAKEVTAFWRGDRLYFFSVIFPPSDTKVREELRRSVSTVLWKQ